VAHGLVNAKKVMDAVKNHEVDYHFIEVMACEGGCIAGPVSQTNALKGKRNFEKGLELIAKK